MSTEYIRDISGNRLDGDDIMVLSMAWEIRMDLG